LTDLCVPVKEIATHTASHQGQAVAEAQPWEPRSEPHICHHTRSWEGQHVEVCTDGAGATEAADEEEAGVRALSLPQGVRGAQGELSHQVWRAASALQSVGFRWGSGFPSRNSTEVTWLRIAPEPGVGHGKTKGGRMSECGGLAERRSEQNRGQGTQRLE
jgi:hypothetical protein